MFFWIRLIISFLLCLGIQTVNSARTYTKYWSVANLIGSIAENSSFKYYLEPQLRLIDTSSIFNQFLLLGGVGYQFNSKLILFIGPGWIATTTPEKKRHTEKRLWEQLNWQVLNNTNLNLNSRTRLEERKRSNEAKVAFRLRERVWLRVPFRKGQSYFFSSFDEVFFNLNHPRWTSPYRFEQNRAFVGIAKQLSKSAILDLGYLNQYLRSTNSQTDNVILISFTMVS